MVVSIRALIVVSTNLVKDPEAIAQVTRDFSEYDVHQQLAERIDERAVQLPPQQFELVHLAAEPGKTLKLQPHSAEAIHASMKDGGRLEGDIDAEMSSVLLIAGFSRSQEPGAWVKTVYQATPSVMLRKPAEGGKKRVLPKFKRAEPAEKLPSLTDISISPAEESDLIDEDDLIADAQPAIQFPAKCDPGPGRKRRKACKDCTCGMKELEEAEIDAQRETQKSVVALSADDLAEIDFTVPGKAVGGCGSCALGDAFRCDGCPYLGLPPFKLGEVVSVDTFGDDF